MCIPPKQEAALVCAMEQVLSVYKHAFDPDYPAGCMVETSVQTVKEVRLRRQAVLVKLNATM